MAHNPYQAYKQQSVMTMTPGDMLTALYDGLLKSLLRAKAGFAKNNITEINDALKKAQSILYHLQNTLDFQFPISNELNMLYDYFIHTIIQINVKKDPTEIDNLLEMVTDLRDTYNQAAKKSRAAEVVG